MAEASLGSRFRRAASFVPSGVAVLHAAGVRMMVSAAVILAAGSFMARVLRHGEEIAAHGDEIPAGPGLVEISCQIREVYRVVGARPFTGWKSTTRLRRRGRL